MQIQPGVTPDSGNKDQTMGMVRRIPGGKLNEQTLRAIAEAPILHTANFDSVKYAEFLIDVAQVIREMKNKNSNETDFRNKILANRLTLMSHSDEEIIDYVNTATKDSIDNEPYFYRALVEVIDARSRDPKPEPDIE